MSLVLLPIPMPYERPYLGGLGSSYAVNRMNQDQNQNHKELMGAVKDMAKDKLSVTVIASDLVPAAEAAYQNVCLPAADYNIASAEFYKRFTRVKARIKARKESRDARAKAKKEAEEFDLAVTEYIRDASWPWPFKPVTREEAEREVKKAKKAKKESSNPYDMYAHYLQRAEMDSYKWARSAPRKPDGYEHDAIIRQLLDTITALPNATLTIPVTTVQIIAKYAKEQPCN